MEHRALDLKLTGSSSSSNAAVVDDEGRSLNKSWICLSVRLLSGRRILENVIVERSSTIFHLRMKVQELFPGSVCKLMSTACTVLDDGLVVEESEVLDGDELLAVISLAIQGIFSTEQAFAALKVDGSVVVWGNKESGGDCSSVQHQLLGNVQHIYSTHRAFAAVKSSGSVVVWGHHGYGGNARAVKHQLLDQVKSVYSTIDSFAALKSDGSVVTWSEDFEEEQEDRQTFQKHSNQVKVAYWKRYDHGFGQVQHVYSSYRAFAALKSDGSVAAWGHKEFGGDCRSVQHRLRSHVQHIYSTVGAFAAVKCGGGVVTWGRRDYGGDCFGLQHQLVQVQDIYSTHRAFAAVKSDSSVVTWGHKSYGADSRAVQDQLRGHVHRVFSTDRAFAVLKCGGSVVAWGAEDYGGNCSAVQDQLLNQVHHIYSTYGAFAALRSDGSLISWGNEDCGGNCQDVQHHLCNQVRCVSSTNGAFAALKSDGSVIVWGNHTLGGDHTAVKHQLAGEVLNIYSTIGAFAAVRRNSDVVTWGNAFCGGDCSAASENLRLFLGGSPGNMSSLSWEDKSEEDNVQCDLNKYLLLRSAGQMPRLPVGYVEGVGVIGHEATGIMLRCPPFQISSVIDDPIVLYHYTSEPYFSSITTNLTQLHLKERSDFGDGFYASQYAPHDFGSKDAILLNNYTNNSESSDQEKDIEMWREKGMVDYCIPIIVPRSMAVDVGVSRTKEILQSAHTIHGKPLRAGRDIWVVALGEEDTADAQIVAEDERVTCQRLSDHDWSVRLRAVQVLASKMAADNHEQGIDALSHLFADPEPEVSIASILAVASAIGEKDQIRQAIQHHAEFETRDRVIDEICNALDLLCARESD